MKMKKKLLVAAAGALTMFGGLALARLWAVPKIYLAPDNHTDYIWSASESQYKTIFLNTLDHYVSQIDKDVAAHVPANLQSRFSTDGSLWLWTYQKNRNASQFNKLMGRIKDGHVSSTLSPLVCMYGGQTAEGILRGMYYPGRLERQYGMRFTLAQAMENDTLPYGLGSLWAGAGVKYTWQGVCNCGGKVSASNLANRGREIYHWTGPDGSQLLTKWYSNASESNTRLGGYAEARVTQNQGNFPSTSAPDGNGSVTDATDFGNSGPFSIIGDFGYGWDDGDMAGHYDDLQTFAKNDSGNPNRNVVVSNEEDFFKDFETTYGSSLASFGASFGNDWDIFPTTMAEVSAHVKRAVETLRSADALATLVSLKNPAFLTSRIAARDQAYMDIGLYFEHDFSANGPASGPRPAWQRRLALNEIDPYVNGLERDAVTALGSLIPKAANPRFFVFNPLGHARTDVADFAYSGALPIRIVDVANAMSEVPSQVVTVDGKQYVRLQAPNVPSAGYKVFEIQTGASCGVCGSNLTADTAGHLGNGIYNVTVAGTGAITSVFDIGRSREFVSGSVNNLGGGGGSISLENVGPVSATLLVTASSPARTTRVTLFLGSDRIEIKNELTANPGGWNWAYNFNLTSPDVHHEEVGAIARARKVSGGGNYSDTTAVYDWLTLNHFVDMTGSGSVGVTLSNADAFFFRLGNSSVNNLDTTTPSITVLGGLGNQSGLIQNQNGDHYFMERFALRTHAAYDPVAAMKFALEHQNPLVTGAVTGSSGYPAASYSYVTVSDPNVLLWALKPADDGIASGVVTRLWNLGSSTSSFSLSLAPGVQSAQKTTHIETPLGSAPVSGGALQGSANAQQIVTYKLMPVGGVQGGGTVHFSAATYSAREGSAARVTVKRDAPTAAPVTIDYAITDGTGHANADYDATSTSGILGFPKGATSRSFTVKTLQNTAVDGDRTVLLSLANPGGGAELGGQTTAVVTIIDNDVGGTVQLASASYTVDEGNANAIVKVTRKSGTASGVTVAYAATPGTAVDGEDFDAVSGTVTFDARQTSQTFLVPIHDDLQVEGHRTVALGLSAPGGGAALGSPSDGTLTILEDNSVLQFSAANYSTRESTRSATIAVRRSGPRVDTVTVTYATSNGTAMAGQDYQATSGILTFTKGATARTFAIPLTNDTIQNTPGPRTVLLNLSPPTDVTTPNQAALGQQSTAVLTIGDNDSAGALQFSTSRYTAKAAAGTARVIVRRVGGSASGVVVHFSTAGGTGVTGIDYQDASGDLTFGAGQSSQAVLVPVLDNPAVSGDKTVGLALSSPTGSAVLGSPVAATLTLTSLDPLVQFSAASYKVNEVGPKATITVKRSGPKTDPAVVHYATSNGTATAGQDYTATSGDLSFAPGATTQTFPVLVTDSGMVQPNQTVNLTLSAATGAAVGPLDTAVLTLVTDDPSVQFSRADFKVAEAGKKASITVKRIGPKGPSFSVPILVTNGSAIDGVNYTAPSPNPATLDFPKGAASRTLVLPILNDVADEPPPLTVNLGLISPTLALLGSPTSAVLTIADNDVAGAVQFSASDFSVSEAGGTALVTISRTGGQAGDVTVDYSASNDTAASGTNYQPASGTVTFDQGQSTATFPVDVLDDGIHTGNLAITLTLTNPQGGADLGSRTTATLWVVDAE
jgi:alpha-mannosidase